MQRSRRAPPGSVRGRPPATPHMRRKRRGRARRCGGSLPWTKGYPRAASCLLACMSSSRKPRHVVRYRLTGVAVVVLVCVAALVFGVGGGLARRGTGGARTVAPQAAGAATAPARTLSITCKSPALAGTLPALVFLPAGYSGHGARYPVVYFLHGLPAGPTSYTKN